MAGEIINLRRARKAKARQEHAAVAAVHRAKFGRPKAERDQDKEQRSIEGRRLDGHRRAGEPEPDA